MDMIMIGFGITLLWTGAFFFYCDWMAKRKPDDNYENYDDEY
jgi:hypothetical protein